MLLYAAILMGTGVLLAILGGAIYRGNINLIHDYHRERVREEDRREYGRAMGRGLFTLAGTFFVSGILALFAQDRRFFAASDILLAVGFVVSVVLFVRAQKKYNGGLF